MQSCKIFDCRDIILRARRLSNGAAELVGVTSSGGWRVLREEDGVGDELEPNAGRDDSRLLDTCYEIGAATVAQRARFLILSPIICNETVCFIVNPPAYLQILRGAQHTHTEFTG